MNPNMLLHEQVKVVMGFPPAASGTSDFVSLKNFAKMTAVLILDNATTPVTGSDITINEAINVGGGSATPLLVGTSKTGYRNVDTGSGDTLAAFTITSGAFTTNEIAAANLLYVIEIDAADLSDGFDCIQIANASGSSTIIGIIYLLWPARYGAAAADQPSAIID